MRKKEILIVAGILLLAVVSLAAYRLLGRGKTATGKINVYVNGALYASEPLRPGQTLTVTQQDGRLINSPTVNWSMCSSDERILVPAVRAAG